MTDPTPQSAPESAQEPATAAPAVRLAGARGAEPRPRVGFWLGLLLVLVPVFYPLLYFRPFSWVARIGWGLWLGLIVFVKVSGLSEPVINLTEIEAELRQAEQSAEQGTGQTAEQANPPVGPAPEAPRAAAEAGAARGLMDTFVAKDEALPPLPPLEDYLRELGGGLLGRRIEAYAVTGTEGAPDAAIRIAFQPTDFYLKNEGDLAAESLGMGLSLCYGREFTAVTLDFVLNGRPVRVQLHRAALADYLGLDEATLRTALTTREGQASLGLGELSDARLAAFFTRFAAYR